MLRNSHRDQRKGDKLVKRFLGPYAVEEYLYALARFTGELIMLYN